MNVNLEMNQNIIRKLESKKCELEVELSSLASKAYQMDLQTKNQTVHLLHRAQSDISECQDLLKILDQQNEYE